MGCASLHGVAPSRVDPPTATEVDSEGWTPSRDDARRPDPYDGYFDRHLDRGARRVICQTKYL